MSKLEERFAKTLHTTARSWRQALDLRLKDLGISQAGWTTVAFVAKSDTPLSQVELANRLGIEGPSMVAMLDRLVKAGLVVREPSPVDRRVKLVMLTEEGTALFGKVKLKATEFRKELLRGIDPGELRAATELLEKLESLLKSAE